MRSPALAKIHIARKDLGLSDDDYRAILTRVAGADSASKLGPSGLAAVLTEFARLGWKAAPKGFGGKRSDKPGVRLIFGLWTELGNLGLVTPTRPALFAFVKRQTNVNNPDWLTAGDVNKVIEGLKAMRRRAKATQGEAP